MEKEKGGGWSAPFIYVVSDHKNKTVPAAPPLSIVMVTIIPTVAESVAVYDPSPQLVNEPTITPSAHRVTAIPAAVAFRWKTIVSVAMIEQLMNRIPVSGYGIGAP